jgi:predicted O-methyltransferase YrrM
MWSTSESERSEICREISRRDRPRVLEVGAFKGETTRALAEAASERAGYVVVIDPMRWSAELVANGIVRHLPSALSSLGTLASGLLGSASYEDAFWENVGDLRPIVRLHRSLSSAHSTIASAAPELQQFDVVFIDGDHGYEGAAFDLRHWGRRAVPGGVVFVHDAIASFPGVLRALEEIDGDRGARVEYPVRGSLAKLRVPLRGLPMEPASVPSSS